MKTQSGFGKTQLAVDSSPLQSIVEDSSPTQSVGGFPPVKKVGNENGSFICAHQSKQSITNLVSSITHLNLQSLLSISIVLHADGKFSHIGIKMGIKSHVYY